jgi:hypothetical protein
MRRSAFLTIGCRMAPSFSRDLMLWCMYADRHLVTLEQERLIEFLVRAIATFDHSRASANLLRRFASEAPDQFLESGFRILPKGSDTAGYKYLAVLLTKVPQVYSLLCDPWKYTLEQAVSIAVLLLKVEPSLETKLTQRLPGRQVVALDETLSPAAAERALDILDQISVGSRLIPILNYLAEHSEKQIAAKATLLLTRRANNEARGRRIETQSDDPRVRANKIELAWQSNTPAALELFTEHLKDEHHRVVGNAIIGLHLAGDPEVGNIVQKIAGDPAHEFRMMSAWAMGRIGDSTFVPMLTRLLKDPHPGVRGTALRALRAIRQIEKRREEERTTELLEKVRASRYGEWLAGVTQEQETLAQK